MVFVSHRMDEVESLCDRVTVLRDGSKVATRAVADTSTDEIIRLIVGHDPRSARDVAPAPRTGPAAAGDALTIKGLEGIAVGPLDLRVAKGSIFGLTGLAGAGQHEIAEILFGRSPLVGGQIELMGKPYKPSSPRAAIARGLGFIPASRAEGVYPEGTLAQNVFDNPGRSGLLVDRGERRRVEAALEAFDVRPRDPDALLSQLSGGNAQKVLLSRWFLRDLDVLILNEPTAGVDIGAREQIHAAMRRAAAERDVTLLIVSSDLEEIASVCDRIAVLYRGTVSAELTGSEVTVPNLSRAAVTNV
jgi:ribose transport system ATP-binding protein